MSTKFYTKVEQWGNDILVCGYDEGTRFREKVKYKPRLFVPSATGKFQTITDTPCAQIDFDSIKEAKEYVDRYGNVDNFNIYGMTKFHYTYLYDNFPGVVPFDYSLLNIVPLDIEVDCVDGFSSPDDADNEITLITLSSKGKLVTLGCQPYTPKSDSVTYIQCRDEATLLTKFLKIWGDPNSDFSPDIVTGWNIEMYDIPYLVNRIRKILGPEAVKKMSPWGIVRARSVQASYGQENTVYDLYGISVIDYLPTYKKFGYKQQESYSLNNVCQDELGEGKVDYGEYETLARLQIENWELYVDYNIRDVILIDRLDYKKKLIALLVAMAYDAKVNFNDTFTTVNLWDVMIHNYLMDRNIVIPQLEVDNQVGQGIIGGYVKDPIPGEYKWVVSFDLNSLYPHIIMQYNISPETYYGEFPYKTSHTVEQQIEDVFNGVLATPEARAYLKDNNVVCTANMITFSRENQGFLPAIMQKLYDDRVLYQNDLKIAKREYEDSKDKKWELEISRLDNIQQAKKIQLNSGYGALANRYNRWYRKQFAEAITSSGQLATKWIERALNKYINQLCGTVDVDYVIACDTDSVYLNLDLFVSKKYPNLDKAEIVRELDQFCKHTLQPYVDQMFEKLFRYVNGFRQAMAMKREVIADKGIWTGKKHYILNVYDEEGVTYSEPKLKIKGIEAIKTSTPGFCRKAIKDILKLIMTTDEQTMQDAIQQFRIEFNQQPFDVVSFPRGVTDLNKWADKTTIWKKSTPIHVKGSLLYNTLLDKYNISTKYEKISEGQKIKFAYLVTPNPFKTNVIAAPEKLPAEFDLNKYIDYNAQFEGTFLKPIKSICEAIGWEVEYKLTLGGTFK